MRDAVTVVMFSCHQRAAAREATIPQFAQLGLHPIVFLDDCQPGPNHGNKDVGRRALTAAVPFGRPILVVEDDIDLAPDFMAGLKLAMSRLDRVTYLYLNESQDRIESIYGSRVAAALDTGTPLPLQLIDAGTDVGLFGTQCALIPLSFVPEIARATTLVRRAFDAAVHRTLKLHPSPPARVVVPNVVQHRHDRTGREPEQGMLKRSLTFDLPRVPQ